MSDGTTSPGDDLAALVAEAKEADTVDEVVAGLTPMIAMRLARRWFAVAAESVQRIVNRESVTRVPSLPPHVLGVAAVQGRLIPVIDLLQLLGASPPPSSNEPGRRLVVLQNEDLEISVAADETHGVIDLPGHRASSAEPGHQLIVGEVRWAERLVCVLDVHSLVAAACAEESF